MDPARLGAQVISGIGFLGAGTILREGFTVKGLTTAASLWAVSCVGLAVGIGYYQGALIATIVIYITLNRLKKFIAKGNTGRNLYIQVVQEANNISLITDIITHNGASLQSFELIYADGEGVSSFKKQKNAVVFKAFIHYSNHEDFMAITEQIRDLEGVTDLYID
ncbi:hypothetical protein SDC9_200528 [bioreactor metagenome]|uniref:MgtC/SapB/SrpB/YhiD N-terminal domain-containing protein n=1 Tax=bioreactor metagenome TaxID=1076179 RepID=A0A645IND6_9ZZZZ